ncbi:LytR/AlgR family response regulator transcription factor [Ruminococcus albus]|uniref:Stage 0 sporulation protein A homolog n=1 Tax=Ruminococcus albus (strain ATCC 27210 / DSM 20455 / JCM 14654 / NCDO 2250 / 7) TaxID=697329 RepID=E6UL72_RUMA7|nr:LytTR family DNA-binding domain-containing protein [Ruminococcus albus]ADU24418.1 two component transcriptional regulator, LytTR family [Ruminococcus albus 7 = DSM 20455]
MKIAICDDQMAMHTELKKHLENYAQKRNLIMIYNDYTNGFDLISSQNEYDIIFMDYQMAEIDGLETARQIRKKNTDTTIIFLTSFPDIVFDTFEVNAYRFLVKPIDDARLEAALDSYLSDNDESNFILIKTDESNQKININDIIYIEASDKYCNIRTNEGTVLFKKTLSEIEKMLPEDKFFRCHRTYLVGFRHIVSHTSTDVLFDNKEKALISRVKLPPFKKAFTNYIKRYNFQKGS